MSFQNTNPPRVFAHVVGARFACCGVLTTAGGSARLSCLWMLQECRSARRRTSSVSGPLPRPTSSWRGAGCLRPTCWGRKVWGLRSRWARWTPGGLASRVRSVLGVLLVLLFVCWFVCVLACLFVCVAVVMGDCTDLSRPNVCCGHRQ